MRLTAILIVLSACLDVASEGAALPPPALYPLCAERACASVVCDDATIAHCWCRNATRPQEACVATYPRCEASECDSLICAVPDSSVCLCLREGMPDVGCAPAIAGPGAPS